MIECPECRTEFQGRKCSCGWEPEQARRERSQAYRPPCAHIGCTEPTIAKIHINKIPVFVCKTHYDAHYTVEARKYSESLGLFTVEQKREWCRKKLASLMAKEPDKEWASQAIEAFEQGKSSIRAIEMACEVLGVTPDYWIKPKP